MPLDCGSLDCGWARRLAAAVVKAKLRDNSTAAYLAQRQRRPAYCARRVR